MTDKKSTHDNLAFEAWLKSYTNWNAYGFENDAREAWFASRTSLLKEIKDKLPESKFPYEDKRPDYEIGMRSLGKICGYNDCREEVIKILGGLEK